MIILLYRPFNSIFFESIFLDQVQDSPEFQTRLGYKSNYDQWDDITWEERKRKIRKGKKLGFSEKASAKARGLIARTGGKNKGKKVKSKKYKK